MILCFVSVYFRLLKNSLKEAKQKAANAAYYVKVMERVLERGYAWLSNAEGQPVLSAAAVAFCRLPSTWS